MHLYLNILQKEKPRMGTEVPQTGLLHMFPKALLSSSLPESMNRFLLTLESQIDKTLAETPVFQRETSGRFLKIPETLQQERL